MRLIAAEPEPPRLRDRIGATLRRLRTTRSWSQADLAERLGLSQARLSRVEHGAASLTAEEFLRVLLFFNVGVDEFVPAKSDGSLQNALVRFGAFHLRQVNHASVSKAHQTPADAVRAVLLNPFSERLVTALAPVLVVSIDAIPLHALQHDLVLAGAPHRLPWLAESVLGAIRSVGAQPDLAWRRRMARASVLVEEFLSHQVVPASGGPIDVIDPGVRSMSDLDITRREGDDLSARWRVATLISPSDFAEALRLAIESS